MIVVQSIKGDGYDENTIKYGKLDPFFKIDNVNPNADCPLTIAKWPELQSIFNKYYENMEINGDTEYDFYCGMLMSYQTNADTLERLLQVYDSDIAKPILGRTEKHTYDLTNSTVSDSLMSSTDVPRDDPSTDKANSRSKSTGTGNTAQTGTETIELSDLGVRPNYESLNGFLDQNRTYVKVFLDFFKEDFIILKTFRFR